MTKEIKIKVTAPISCTDKEFDDWIRFCLGYVGNISMENPLHEYELETDSVEIS